MLDDLSDDVLRRALIGLDDQVGDLPVEGISLVQDSSERGAGVGSVEQGPAAGPGWCVRQANRGARRDRSRIPASEDASDYPSRAPHRPRWRARCRCVKSAHRACRVRAGGSPPLLQLENERDRRPGALLQLPVAVQELLVEGFGELSPHRGLARSHRADEKDVLGGVHRLAARSGKDAGGSSLKRRTIPKGSEPRIVRPFRESDLALPLNGRRMTQFS